MRQLSVASHGRATYAGPKQTVLWPYNGHEAGGDLDEENALDFAATHLAPRTD